MKDLQGTAGDGWCTTLFIGLLLSLVVAGPATAGIELAADLLLPEFAVDLEDPGGLTTLFAVGNPTDEAVLVRLTVHTNWGVPILESEIVLQPKQTGTFNLRDWIVNGFLPDRRIRGMEHGHFRAALAGQQSPRDELYYSTEVAPGLAVGYVTIQAVGVLRPEALYGDYFVVDPSQNFARGELLVHTAHHLACREVCRRHAVRFMTGGAFDGGTELIAWTARQHEASANPFFPDRKRIHAQALFYNDAGQLIDERDLWLLPQEGIDIGSLAPPEPFGWIDISFDEEAFLGVRYAALGAFSVGFETVCLPAKAGPGIRLEKRTNGDSADLAPGPFLTVGDAVEWTYTVINTGGIPLSGISVVDDQGVAVSCPKTTLAPGESMLCTGSGTVTACQYRNIGSVVAQTPDGSKVRDSDPSHYFGGLAAAIDIEKSTNGHDADTAPGPVINEGAAVQWTYRVTNTGAAALSDVAVSDDQGVAVSCPRSSLGPGESMTCTGSGTAVAGQYKNIGTVSAKDSCGATVRDSDASHYHNTPVCTESPGVDLEKSTNGHDADHAPGPSIDVGQAVNWAYRVRNTGNSPLSNIAVSDDKLGAISCPKASLAAGESMTCSAGGVAQAGQYANLGTVHATTECGAAISDSDPSHYFGETGCVEHAGMSIEKSTNGHDADALPGPEIPVGDPVVWRYVVTNTGDSKLEKILVKDDKLGPIGCPKSELAAGESMTCVAHGIAVAGQYRNEGWAQGTSECGKKIMVDDPSHYFGKGCTEDPPKIDLEKKTNGHDADFAPGPTLEIGSAVQWTYQVRNTGASPLSNVQVVDDKLGAVSCPKSSLAVGESMTCSAHGTAQEGQYRNEGWAKGTSRCNAEVEDHDPSHYFGKCIENASIRIEKATNGHDADTAPGPTLEVGDAVTWSYVVTNTGDSPLSNVLVTDDKLGAISCPKSSLAAGESMTCSASGTAQAGQYRNVGSVSAKTRCGKMVHDDDPSHYWGQEPPGGKGCSPGYWKNHTDSWPPSGYSPGQSVQGVFSAAAAFPAIGSASLHEALNFGGGSGVEGAARTLMRQSVASLLNSSHPGVSFPRTTAGVISQVNSALASGDRNTMLSLASALDHDNNLGCPLN